MSLDPDFTKILLSFNSIKSDLSESSTNKLTLTLKEAKDLLIIREVQLKTVIEISEKLIHQFESTNKEALPITMEQTTEHSELNKKFSILKNSYKITEENLKKSLSEIQKLKKENEALSRTQGNNNFFSLELYQSEIEDLRKQYAKQINELEGKI